MLPFISGSRRAALKAATPRFWPVMDEQPVRSVETAALWIALVKSLNSTSLNNSPKLRARQLQREELPFRDE
jgi:hypothetical protein